MNYALISPNETVKGLTRIAQVESVQFEVAPPLFWVECDDTVKPETHGYETQTHSIVSFPEPTIEEKTQSALSIKDKLLNLFNNHIATLQLTAEQQSEANEYIQALSNIQLQPGFPNDIVWPIRPSF